MSLFLGVQIRSLWIKRLKINAKKKNNKSKNCICLIFISSSRFPDLEQSTDVDNWGKAFIGSILHFIGVFFREVGRLSKNSFWSDNQFRCLTFIPYTEDLFRFLKKNRNSRSAFLYIMFVKLMPKCAHSMGENDRGHELFGSIILTPEEYLMNWPFIMKEPNLHYLKC